MVWYMEDLNDSYQDTKVVEKIMKDINDRFGYLLAKLGTEHNYVGINLKYNGIKNG